MHTGANHWLCYADSRAGDASIFLQYSQAVALWALDEFQRTFESGPMKIVYRFQAPILRCPILELKPYDHPAFAARSRQRRCS